MYEGKISHGQAMFSCPFNLIISFIVVTLMALQLQPGIMLVALEKCIEGGEAVVVSVAPRMLSVML